LLIKDSLILGFIIFIKRFCLSILISFFASSWFSLIFFLVYIGGILVLIFYTLIWRRNPRKKKNKKLFGFFCVFFFCIVFFWYFSLEIKLKIWEKIFLDLWTYEEINFIIGVLILLLIVLWLISKLKFNLKRAFRPFF
jgi:hypothetical protein